MCLGGRLGRYGVQLANDVPVDELTYDALLFAPFALHIRPNKAEGMAEYATNPAAYAQGITAQVVSQFAPPGTDPASVVVNGPTEQRVIRIMRKVVEGAAKTLKRLHAEAKDPEEKVRLERAMEMLQRRWTVVVIDNDAVNAFVHPLLPGATFFLTGLVGPAADYTDEEIAMVCAHELSHALFEHGREALATQGILTALKVVVLTALDPTGVLSLVIEVLFWFAIPAKVTPLLRCVGS